jgi:hypothetical protein
VVHSDIGVLPVPTFSGCRYFVVFVDEYTRYIFARLMKRKSDIYEAYEEYRKETRNKINWIYYNLPGTGEEIDLLRSDNGAEYAKLGRIIKEKYGTHMRFTQVYTPQDNWIAERRMRMIMEKARAFLFDGHHPVVLIREAIMAAVVVINITPTAVLDGDSPHERWFGTFLAPPIYESLDAWRIGTSPKISERRRMERQSSVYSLVTTPTRAATSFYVNMNSK